MKKTLIINSLLLFAITTFSQIALPNNIQQQKFQKISFIENKGQVSDQFLKPRPDILYSGTDGQMTFYIKKSGISYQLNRIDSYKEEVDRKTKQKCMVPDKNTVYRVDALWKNCNENITEESDELLPGSSNFYLESCPNGVHNVKTYSGVILKNIYKNIKVHYYETAGKLKCDYVVEPGGDYKQIQLEIKGAEIVLQKNGKILYKTPLGDIQEGAPIVYQAGKKLTASWQVKGNILSFSIKNYDPKLSLIIDPVTRVWGTYLGGILDDRAVSCTNDAAGNLYMTGFTKNTGTLIATVGAHQISYGGGSQDAFLEKYDPSGVRLMGTYYGGGFIEYGTSCAVDASGNIFLAGYTQSPNNIATPGSHQPNQSGGFLDGFLVKFNASGVRQWGTYYGGPVDEWIYSCAIDPTGNVYIAGTTTSSNAIASGGYDMSLTGSSDAFLVKFNTSGVRLWGTYYGGISDEEGYCCATDISGNIYLSGYSNSVNNNTCCINPIASPGSHQYNLSALDDGFLVKFDSGGSRTWGTYYGGSSNDYAYTCCTYSNTFVYIGGYTQSVGQIQTAGSHQSSIGGGVDGFLAKFSSAGVRSWGTFYGGSATDYVGACKTDPSGNVYIVGTTSSNIGSVIATNGSHQSSYGGGTDDAFAAKFSTGGIRQWGTYYGGAGIDYGNGCTAPGNGVFYICGASTSSVGTIIATAGSDQPVNGGAYDVFLAQFNICVNLNITSSPSVICSGSTATITGTGADSYTWAPGGSNSPSFVITPTTSVTYTLTGAALGCTNSTATFSFAVNPLPTITVNSGTTCMGQAYTLTPAGAITYSYTGGGPVVSPTVSSTYTITGTDANGCISNPGAVSTVTVIAPTITVNSGAICIGQSFTMNPSGAVSYTYSGGSPVVSPTVTSAYTVTGTDAVGCVNFIGAVSDVTVGAIPIITVNSGSICIGQSFTMAPGGAGTYTFSSGNAIVTPTANAFYTVTGTSSLGCLSASFATSNVTVNPSPTITIASSNSLLCIGESATLTAGGANSYTWNIGGNNQNKVISPSVTTNYTVTGTDANGCASTATIAQNVDACAGISTNVLNSNLISIYPNPNNGIFTINLAGLSNNACLEIYNSIGQIVLKEKISNSEVKINFSDKANGIYLVRIIENSKVLTQQKITKY